MKLTIQEKSWILYDCGNSAYSMAVTTSLLPIVFGIQLGFIITSLWWGLLTLPIIKNVHQLHFINPEPRPVQNSFIRLKSTFINIKKYKTVAIFLIAYFFYIDGVDTIIKMVVPYATSILGSFSTSFTGNARYSILSIIPLFIIGLLVLITLPKEHIVRDIV